MALARRSPRGRRLAVPRCLPAIAQGATAGTHSERMPLSIALASKTYKRYFHLLELS